MCALREAVAAERMGGRGASVRARVSKRQGHGEGTTRCRTKEAVAVGLATMARICGWMEPLLASPRGVWTHLTTNGTIRAHVIKQNAVV